MKETRGAISLLVIGASLSLQRTEALCADEPGDTPMPCCQNAQDAEPASRTASDSQKVDVGRLVIVGGTAIAGMVSVQIYQANGWWKDNRTSFHFREDLDYSRGVDKLGHLYGASAFTFMVSKALRWSNLEQSDALLYGAAGSIFWQTFIEVQDGFSTWGFDRVDFAANLVGAFYPFLQYSVPTFRDFNLKFSYHPSDLLNTSGGIGFRGQEHLIFDDYEGQTVWLNVNVNNLLPRGVEPYWPDWLAIALGYGARSVAGPDPHSVLLLSLDYDMTRIIPGNNAFLQTLGEALNFIHFPAPAVRISPDAIWYGLYF